MTDRDLALLERRADGVALVTLNRPKANALSRALLRRLAEVTDELAADPPGAVVIWGGPRIFAAGADIDEFGTTEHADALADQFHTVTAALESLPRATVAAITGYALGGGFELALGCDLRVMADTAKVGQPEILLGVIPGGGGTQRLARLVGASRAKDLIFTGRQVGAEEALRLGLADRVVSADRTLEEAVALAATMAAGPLAAIGLAKHAIDAGLDVPLAQGLRLEQQAFTAVFETEDAVRGVGSFKEHGPGRATFVGR